MAAISKKSLKSMTLLQLIEKVVNLSFEKPISVANGTKPYVNELSERTGLTPMQALFLSVLVNLSNGAFIRVNDIARHFGCRNISVLAHYDVITELISKRIVLSMPLHGETAILLHPLLLDSLKNNKLFDLHDISDLSINEFVDVIDDWFIQVSEEEIETAALTVLIFDIIEQNKHLELIQKMKEVNLDLPGAINFLLLVAGYSRHQKMMCDQFMLRMAMKRRDLDREIRQIESDEHILIREKMIEHCCVDGQADESSWCLTNYSKNVLLKGLRLDAVKKKHAMCNDLIHHEDIEPKELFFSESVSKQIKSLEALLEKDKMNRIIQRLADNGMRKGFTCIFYGAPGTGKTEACRQLSRLTGRDIMLVNIPSIRSKWVGETEQNIKMVFDNYKSLVKRSQTDGSDFPTPILLFNEADALLNKRNENCVTSVDKMENAMQNIILQEMETFEGIMIATTNLTASLDSAFERRFLYKVEFCKPTPNERQHIWKSLIPSLSDDDALKLAQRFDFSGGQIENIARKRIISNILDERDEIDVDSIIEFCHQEQLGSASSKKRIGF